jgi:hypothetical protein
MLDFRSRFGHGLTGWTTGRPLSPRVGVASRHMRVPDIELLWWEGCPSTERARSELALALEEVGLPGAEVRMREIRTEAHARAAGFAGSPTILVDGEDLVGHSPTRRGDGEHGGGEHGGLSCRIYRRRDGRISPTPDPDDLRDALLRAATRVETRR